MTRAIFLSDESNYSTLDFSSNLSFEKKSEQNRISIGQLNYSREHPLTINSYCFIDIVKYLNITMLIGQQQWDSKKM